MEVPFKVQNLLSSLFVFKTFRHFNLQFKYKVTFFYSYADTIFLGMIYISIIA